MFFRTIAFAVLCAFASTAFGEEFSEQRAAVGKKNGTTYQLGGIDAPAPDPSEPEGRTGTTTGLYAALNAILFGKDREILKAKAGVTDLLEGESEFYWGGFRVWNSKPTWKDGAFQYEAGLPTVSMRAPLVRLPVGPVTLAVDAGVVAEASIRAKLAPLISIPIQFTSVKATLESQVAASGFVEGYAKWLIVRAGIGGELKLAHVDAGVSGTVGFAGLPPQFTFKGFISLLSGKVYGFVDYMNVFRWKWKRALEPVIANWKGKCIALSPTAGGADPCASLVP
jgi:hypothetical protein